MFGLYIHVPFCTTRCGYCDFNTYTPGELQASDSTEAFLISLDHELERASEFIPGPVNTVFVGGGTPSLLGATGLARVLNTVRNHVGIAPGAEVTTESNPESVSRELFDAIRTAGYNRVSLGMQSASASVLRVLDRQHTPGRAEAAVKEALAAGFEHVNLDMIYGTPTETDDDVRATLEAILGAGVDHVSAYSLIVEEGTAMARKVNRGQLPDEDVYADRYAMISDTLADAGFAWYEVSNWAKPGGQCEHNLLYWRNQEWWGAGPGAHSKVGNTRFYNVKYPARYNAMLRKGQLPIAEREELTASDVHTEELMLGLRLREGVSLDRINPAGQEVVHRNVQAGFLRLEDGRVAPTEQGRYLIDGIIADILVAEED